MAAVDAFEGPFARDQSISPSELHGANAAVRSRRFHSSIARRTISTFYCDTARVAEEVDDDNTASRLPMSSYPSPGLATRAYPVSHTSNSLQPSCRDRGYL
jgi:hypothetical protein